MGRTIACGKQPRRRFYKSRWSIEEKVMEIVWVLLLSVCSTNQCITQTVLETTAKDKCIYHKVMHEQVPPDGSWGSIEYTCQPKDSVQI